MLVICAYLSAMAGITALCYVFRRRSADEAEEDQCPPGSDALNSGNNTESSKAKGLSTLTSEAQSRIQEVLELVNTPSEHLEPVLIKDGKQLEEGFNTPGLMQSMYNKKPNEVLDEMKQSQAKVEAWISELDKVIKPDELDTTERHAKSAVESSPIVVKTNQLALAVEARKKAADDRIAKVKEEMARRRNVFNNRMEANKKLEAEREREREREREKEREKERAREEERKTARKKWAALQDHGTYKREVIEIPKRRAYGESVRSAASAKSKHYSTQDNRTSDDHRGTKRTSAAKEEQAGTSKNRSQVGRTAATHRNHESDAEEKEVVGRTNSRNDYKFRGTSKTMASFNTANGVWIAPERTTSRTTTFGGRSPPSSKIPLMVNSRARPPVARTTERVQKKVPLTVVQKPKKTIRITSPCPLPSRRPDYLTGTPTPEAESVSYNASSSVYNDVFKGRASYLPGQETSQSIKLPELNIIDVKETHSFIPQEVTEITTDNAARVARSGPIRIDRNNSVYRTRSQSTANLRAPPGTLRDGQPMAVSKTVELPEGTDDNVTVYFTVTMPRRPSTNSNWKGNDERLDSDHTITLNGAENISITQLDVDDLEGNGNQIGGTIDDDDHSDDGVFPDEIHTGFDEYNDADQDLFDASSLGGEFDSCDDQ